MRLNVDQKRILDREGRERIFNGINMVFKGVDDSAVPGGRRYTKDYKPEDFSDLKVKGINLVRLGIVWDAIEHEMGVYNETYLSWIESLLDYCKQNDIAVFLDMHQDLYSRAFDGGAPLWATLTEGAEHLKGELWSDAYLFSEAVNKAYLNFWKNKPTASGKGLLEHYSELWQHVITRVGKHDAVIGYDFINEPFPGENALDIMGTLLMTYSHIKGLDKSPEEMLAAYQDDTVKFEMLSDLETPEIYQAMTENAKPMVEKFDKGYLFHFYNKMTEEIRKITSDGLVFTENCYFSNMGIESSVQKIKLQAQEEPLQVYSPHGYDLVVDTPAIIFASNKRIKTILDAHKRVQERLNVPVVFGEWGAHGANEAGLEHIEYLMNYFDSLKWSHTYYCWEENMAKLPVMRVLSRPYPQAVAGTIESYGFDFSNYTFKCVWFEEEQLEKPTVIFLPSMPDEIQFDSDYYIEKSDDESCYMMIPSKGQRKCEVILNWR